MGLGSEMQDSEKPCSVSRIQGHKRHRIPDADPQQCILEKDMLFSVGRQRCGGAVCKVNGASSYSLGSLSDITYDPNSDALRVRYVEVRKEVLTIFRHLHIIVFYRVRTIN
jgi:hypothetical protein